MGFVVDGKLRVFAYPNPKSRRPHTGTIPQRNCWPGHHFTAAEITAFTAKVARVSPEYYIIGYDDLNDLISQITILLNNQTWISGTPPVIHHHPCLEVLELNSHSNPSRCGGVCRGNMDQFADAVDALNYCDELRIYLSGCNTGCRDGARGGANIAELLADLIPAARRHRQYRCTVYGTKGYQNGANASKDSSVTRQSSSSSKIYDYSQDQPTHPTPISTLTDPTYRGFRGANSA